MVKSFIASIGLIIIAVILIIISPMLIITCINYLLSQMFMTFIPLSINPWNWLAVAFLCGGGFLATRN